MAEALGSRRLPVRRVEAILLEAIAVAYGLNPEGGSRHARFSSRASESSLQDMIRVVRNPGAARWGFFLRAETMHGLYTYLEGLGPGTRFHELSHGESFLQVLVATHSPVIAALPGARILQLDDAGFSDCRWDDLALVSHYRRFLAAPDRYLRYLDE